MHFSSVALADLDRADAATLDGLPFGTVGLNRANEVEVYSAAEARMAGLSRDTVLGRHFFTAVAPCMNNRLVAQRFEDEPSLDAAVDYVLTFRMRPTPVKVRLLQEPDAPRRYILIQR
ncbi:MAG TPA: PAS domain-containing protein [Beijerinckiaceae bacterium]|jgi:photoactive yellow protein